MTSSFLVAALLLTIHSGSHSCSAFSSSSSSSSLPSPTLLLGSAPAAKLVFAT